MAHQRLSIKDTRETDLMHAVNLFFSDTSTAETNNVRPLQVRQSLAETVCSDIHFTTHRPWLILFLALRPPSICFPTHYKRPSNNRLR
ncbi:uncharacterized protein MYCGRDRAFT_83337 [Zymoseptoria tritici IPO323]|uniref:Uncharacterized protein n=1 Tax=Zymoseptoria tritici (strain CBS 115943 / IPO323) TaxID=336722 RepID=F9WXH3_ZYMTI|nr:uncharacterized protein MYCGRDRAFT_83337 [Zymoseptoria tritici IPO323]EGP90864.1 hypothetical protein MYCGRDRAFT_83337 [Zymoseptoria tritici IPO323]